MKLVSLISACALSLGAAGSAQADVIFNNFGPNYAYDTNGGWSVGITGLSSGAIAAPRMLFTSNGDYSVTQIDLALGLLLGFGCGERGDSCALFQQLRFAR
jgi:hypothetical protein